MKELCSHGSHQTLRHSDIVLSVIPAALHLLFVGWMVLRYPISIIADPGRNRWDYFWQLIPVELLRTECFTSLWNLHSQPPLYNFLGAILLTLSPSGQHLKVLHIFNVCCGAALCWLLYFPARALLARRWLCLLVCCVFALHPSLPLYEAYILYDVFTVFLVGVALACVALFQLQRQRRWLAGYFVGLNLLVLTRTIFHPAVLIWGLLMACVWAGARWRRMLSLGLLISLPVLGWCAKNYVKFGFWGTTSWTGMNLWRIASSGYSRAEVKKLADQGLLDPMVVLRNDFQWPRELAHYGFDATSRVSVLNREDFNNINIPGASRIFLKNARRLIRYSPSMYFETVQRGALLFCSPSFDFSHLKFNARVIPRYLDCWRVLHGKQPPGIGGSKRPQYGSLVMWSYIVALVVFVMGVIREVFVERESLFTVLDHRPLEFAMVYIIIWVALVGCLFEIGENDRFRFIIEYPSYIFVIAMLRRLLDALALKRSGHAAAPPDGARPI